MQNNQVQVGFSDEFAYDNLPIKYDITIDGHLGLYVEDCARALGVIDRKKLQDGSYSITVRWNRVYDDLVGIGILPFEGKYINFTKSKKKLVRKQLKQMLISNEELIVWCNRIHTVNSDKLIQLVNIYKTYYVIKTNRRREIEFLDKLEQVFRSFNIKGIRQYKVLTYRIDYYIPSLNIAIEYDENNHKNYTYEQHELRQKLIERELGCKFIRVNDSNSDEYNIGQVIKGVIKYEVS